MYTCTAAATIALAPNRYNDVEEGQRYIATAPYLGEIQVAIFH